jgi:hypothetical protein
MAGSHDLLVNIIEKALRSEAAIRDPNTKRSTTYYAGRRAGLVVAAAMVVDQLYGGDYEEAKSIISKGVRAAGEGWPPSDLRDPEKGAQIAAEVAAAAL